MTQGEMILGAALVVSLLGHLIGARLYLRLVDQHRQTLRDLESTVRHATAAIRSGFKSVRREIKRAEEITGQKRVDMLRTMDSREERTMDAIRDLMHTLQLQGLDRSRNPSGTNVNIHGGTSGINNIGTNEVQGDQRKG